MALGGLDQRVDGSGARTGLVGADEAPVATAKGRRGQAILGTVVVRLAVRHLTEAGKVTSSTAPGHIRGDDEPLARYSHAMNAPASLPQSLDRLKAIMARLRDPHDGCPWDLVQNFATIAPYTIEEAYEVAEAIAVGDMAELKAELGDLLFQVIFHSRLAEEAGHFRLDDVIAAICDKMERRHPHIFGEAVRAADAVAQKADWEAIKAAERDAAGRSQAATSALDGVAIALPALMRAEKLQSRAARVGFDWPDIAGVRAKVDEELAEFDTATSAAHRREEAGDLLFVVVNLLRRDGIDAEDALRAGNAKFERRFRAMEALAGKSFAALSLDAQEALWQRVKASEKQTVPVLPPFADDDTLP